LNTTYRSERTQTLRHTVSTGPIAVIVVVRVVVVVVVDDNNNNNNNHDNVYGAVIMI